MRLKQRELDMKIEKAINDIFKTYDRDSSGFLDKQESKNLVREMLSNLGLHTASVRPEEFDQIFERFDKNQDGVIQKSEVKDLVYALSNLKNPNSKVASAEKTPEIRRSKNGVAGVDKSGSSLNLGRDS